MLNRESKLIPFETGQVVVVNLFIKDVKYRSPDTSGEMEGEV